MLDINAWEAVIILAVAFVVIGPDRLPEYAAKLGRLVRRLRVLADGARGQLREQMGPDFDDIDWRAYDPRQYDPRRIVRQALSEPIDETAADSAHTGNQPVPESRAGGQADPVAGTAATSGGTAATAVPARPFVSFDPDRLTPYDDEAT